MAKPADAGKRPPTPPPEPRGLGEATADLRLLRLDQRLGSPDDGPEGTCLRHDRAGKRAFWQRLERIASLGGLADPSFPRPNLEFTLPVPSAGQLRLDPDKLAPPVKLALATDTVEAKIDWQVASQLEHKTPQFTLRNVTRLQREVDLNNPPPFDETTSPKRDAEAELDEVRKAHIEPPDLLRLWTGELIADFATFLEEVLYLCPWEMMPKGLKGPDDDSPWSPAHSRAKLTYEIIDRQRSVLAFGHNGVPITFMRRKPKRMSKTRSLGPPMDGGDGGGTMG